MTSLADFFSQVGADACPSVDRELAPKSIVAVAYTVNKWGPAGKEDNGSGDWNIGFNIKGVYLLVNGPSK